MERYNDRNVFCHYSHHFSLLADVYVTFSLLRRSVLVRGCVSQFKLDGNETGVDLVLIQLFLLSCVNHIVLMLTSIFQAQFYKKTKEVL